MTNEWSVMKILAYVSKIYIFKKLEKYQKNCSVHQESWSVTSDRFANADTSTTPKQRCLNIHGRQMLDSEEIFLCGNVVIICTHVQQLPHLVCGKAVIRESSIQTQDNIMLRIVIYRCLRETVWQLVEYNWRFWTFPRPLYRVNFLDGGLPAVTPGSRCGVMEEMQ